MIKKISVVILTKNNERTLKKTLESTQEFDEVVILDNGSLDNTLEIVKTFQNISLIHTHFTSFGAMRNMGAHLAKNDWIFALDSDEVISDELLKELKSLSLEDCSYAIPFKNFYNGRHIKWCGWHPEFHLRLYHKKKAQFSEKHLHEGLVSTTAQKKLSSYILHTPYLSTSDFLKKMELYSTLFAKEYQGKKKSSFFKALWHGMGAFFKSYVVKRGFLGGKEGFIISSYQANTTFYKYIKLAEKNKERCF